MSKDWQIYENNRVLNESKEKEPYWNRILDTRFYPVSCIYKAETEFVTLRIE